MRGWWRRHSVRARLTVAATAVIAVVMAASAALLVWRVYVTGIAALDATVTREAAAVATAVGGGGAPQVPARLAGDAAVQVVDAAGRVIASSANIDGEPRLFRFPGKPALSAVTVRTVRNVPLGDNGDYRVAAVTGQKTGTGTTVVYVGLPIEPTTHTVTQLVTAIGLGLPLLVAFLAFVTWALVGRALRPVERLRRQAADITVSGLHRRIDVPPARDELSRLAATLNELLAALETSLTKQHRFVADAAHELRSPVASLLVQLEVAERGDELPTVGEMANEVRRLAALIDDLLALARIDSSVARPTTLVDLDDIVMDEVARVRSTSIVDIDVSGVSAARVRADSRTLTRVVRNLLDNATRHARSRVVVALSGDEPAAVLTVADDGPGIPPAQRRRIFERFVRLDESRDRDEGGAGLGLAIAREVVESYDGQIAVDDNHPGTKFIVRLPVAMPEFAPMTRI